MKDRVELLRQYVELMEQLEHASEMFKRGLATISDLNAINDAINEVVEEMNDF